MAADVMAGGSHRTAKAGSSEVTKREVEERDVKE